MVTRQQWSVVVVGMSNTHTHTHHDCIEPNSEVRQEELGTVVVQKQRLGSALEKMGVRKAIGLPDGVSGWTPRNCTEQLVELFGMWSAALLWKGKCQES